MNFLSHLFYDLFISFHAVVPNWGLALILFTVSIRAVLLPFQYMIFKESKKLRLIQPELKRLLEKYKESPQTYFAESSKLKRSVGVRTWIPFMGAMLQIPIFFSIYRLIPQITGLKRTAFLWLPNLSGADPFWILPLIMAALFLIQQNRIKSTQSERAQLPSWVMPAMSFFFMVSMPSALVLHSIFSLIVQMGGEQLFNRLA